MAIIILVESGMAGSCVFVCLTRVARPSWSRLGSSLVVGRETLPRTREGRPRNKVRQRKGSPVAQVAWQTVGQVRSQQRGETDKQEWQREQTNKQTAVSLLYCAHADGMIFPLPLTVSIHLCRLRQRTRKLTWLIAELQLDLVAWLAGAQRV